MACTGGTGACRDESSMRTVCRWLPEQAAIRIASGKRKKENADLREAL